jgi:hypothetical protein
VTSLAVGAIVFACVFGGALLGMFLRTRLPEPHLSADTKDVVKVAIALVATMTALVLSLMISSAKAAYDKRTGELVHLSADIVLLDRVLVHYGPAAADARALLRRSVAVALERVWPADGVRPAGFDQSASPAEAIHDKIAELSPQNEAQRTLAAQASTLATDMGQTRFLLFANLASSIPLPFLVILVFWLTMIFASFGLFAPANATVTIVFLVCALSVAGAIFLVLELDRSFEGLIQVSSAPLRFALSQLGQ